MYKFMPHLNINLLAIIFLSLLISACDNSHSAKNHRHGDSTDVVVKGIHGGRLLTRGDFTLELSIFESGVPPEFRVWASVKDQQLKPSEFDLNITLTRLGGKRDEIKFTPHGDALRGDSVIYEPHSFVVTINATHNSEKYHWQYDNFEGRTKIETAVAKALEIKTQVAGAAVLRETITVYGQIKTNSERLSKLNARFAGVIKSVSASIGDRVKKGQTLASIESNESLNLYSIKAPISGVIIQRSANAGEQTGNSPLFTIADTSTVWVDLAVFPGDINRVKIGSSVSIVLPNQTKPIAGNIDFINPVADANQSVMARLIVDNKTWQLIPGSYINAKIKVAQYAVPLAVKRSGLQAFRDFTVVYQQIGEEYEVRMLELGREDDEWVEVLGGLQAGAFYVSENSYVIKADIEKSGASHDH